MRRFAPFLLPLSVLALAIYALRLDAKPVRADVNLAVATPNASTTTCRVKNVCFDYIGQTITVYYAYYDGAGNATLQGGTVTVPFPAPTPAILGTVKQAVEKALAGQGTIPGVTPIASGTVVP